MRCRPPGTETRALTGEPGRSVVIARRAGEVWYVGGINGQDAPASAPFVAVFLGAGAWTAQLIQDGADDRSFNTSARQLSAKDVIDVPMRARGGFVMRITKTF